MESGILHSEHRRTKICKKHLYTTEKSARQEPVTLCAEISAEMEKIMSTTQPIRTKEDLSKLEHYFDGNSYLERRNYLLIIMGLNTALRVTDMLKLRWSMVYDFKCRRQKTHIELTEQKTGKKTRIAMNNTLKEALNNWMALKTTLSLKAPVEKTRSTGTRLTALSAAPPMPAGCQTTSAAIPCAKPSATRRGGRGSLPRC